MAPAPAPGPASDFVPYGNFSVDYQFNSSPSFSYLKCLEAVNDGYYAYNTTHNWTQVSCVERTYRTLDSL